MKTNTKKLRSHAWGLLIAHFPSRRVRRLWLRGMLGTQGAESFVALHVAFMQPGNTHVGARAVINSHCIIDGRGHPVRIGDDTDIGTHTHIWTLQHDVNDADHGTTGGPVTIGDHVWIASRVTVLPGVSIGRGAVVAAGAVVTRDVPDLAIVAGVPAQVIGQRRNDLTYKLQFAPRFR